MNQITILFFATIREKTGQKKIFLDVVDGYRVIDLKRLLSETYPTLRPVIDRTLVAINQNYALDDEIIPLRAEVALFPAVSGGSDAPTIVDVVETALDLDAILAQVSSEETGAVCMFTGIVRGITAADHRVKVQPETLNRGLSKQDTAQGVVTETVSLEYEAYTPMALLKMRQIAGEIREKWPAVYGVALIQRIGLLKPVTPTVLVACSAAHRDTGVFDAARYGIDRLKEIVPIWKKEIGPDGEEWVEGSYLPTQGD